MHKGLKFIFMFGSSPVMLGMTNLEVAKFMLESGLIATSSYVSHLI